MKWGNCRKNLPIITNLTFKSGINKFDISGEFQVKEKVDGKLQFTIETVKCSMDLKECQRYVLPVSFDDICEMFERKMRFYTLTFESVVPPFKCPLKPGIHIMSRSTIDLGIVSLLPLDGSMWVTTFKIIEKNTKKMVMCLNSETKIIRKRVRN